MATTPRAPSLSDLVDPRVQGSLAPALPKSRTGGEIVGDSARGAAQNVVGLTAGMAAQVPNMLTGGALDEYVVRPAQRALDRALGGVGQDYGLAGASRRMSEGLSSGLSPVLKAEQQKLQDADGWWNKAKTVATNPTLLGQFAAEQVPTLLTLGVGAAGTAAAKGSQVLARGGTQAAAQQAGKKAAERSLIGANTAMGAGFAGTGAQQDAMSQPQEVWDANPEYQALVRAGTAPDQAKQQLALRAGQIAGAIAAPISGAAGAITAPLEASIFTRTLGAGVPALLSKQGAGIVARGIGKEAAEEAIQEGGEQFGQNVGIQQAVDPTRALSQDVADNAAIGGVLGGVLGGGLTAGGLALSRDPLRDVPPLPGAQPGPQQGQPPRPAAPRPPSPAEQEQQLRTAVAMAQTPEQAAAAGQALAGFLEQQGRLLEPPQTIVGDSQGNLQPNAPTPPQLFDAPRIRLGSVPGGVGSVQQAPRGVPAQPRVPFPDAEPGTLQDAVNAITEAQPEAAAPAAVEPPELRPGETMDPETGEVKPREVSAAQQQQMDLQAALAASPTPDLLTPAGKRGKERRREKKDPKAAGMAGPRTVEQPVVAAEGRDQESTQGVLESAAGGQQQGVVSVGDGPDTRRAADGEGAAPVGVGSGEPQEPDAQIADGRAETAVGLPQENPAGRAGDGPDDRGNAGSRESAGSRAEADQDRADIRVSVDAAGERQLGGARSVFDSGREAESSLSRDVLSRTRAAAGAEPAAETEVAPQPPDPATQEGQTDGRGRAAEPLAQGGANGLEPVGASGQGATAARDGDGQPAVEAPAGAAAATAAAPGAPEVDAAAAGFAANTTEGDTDVRTNPEQGRSTGQGTEAVEGTAQEEGEVEQTQQLTGEALTAERKRIGLPRVIRKADAVAALRRAGMKKPEAEAAFNTLERKGLKEGTRMGDDVAALIAARTQPAASAPAPGEVVESGPVSGRASVDPPAAATDAAAGAQSPAKDKALRRIERGTAFFATRERADEFIATGGIGDTHEAVQAKPGRFDVRAKQASAEPAAAAPEPLPKRGEEDRKAMAERGIKPGMRVAYEGKDGRVEGTVQSVDRSGTEADVDGVYVRGLKLEPVAEPIDAPQAPSPAEQVRAAAVGAPPGLAKTFAKMADAIASKDEGVLNNILGSVSNAKSREVFQAATGVKLPRTVSGTKAAISAWAQQPASAARVESAAAEAATSPNNDLPAPTEAQKDAGNYKKGALSLHGLRISIENPAGTRRRPEWPPLAHHYGYIRGTEGKDGDHVDVFLGPDAENADLPVFVVDQVTQAGRFDEHKVMMGFADEAAAREGYLANYSPGWSGLGGITQMTLTEFKAWVMDPARTSKRASADQQLQEPAVGAPAAESEVAAEEAGAQSGPIRDFGEKIGGARKDTAAPTGARGSAAREAEDDRPTWAKRYEIRQIILGSDPDDVGNWTIHDKRTKDRMGQQKLVGERNGYATREDAEAALPLIELARNHRITMSTGADGEREFLIVRSVTDRKYVVLKKGFASRDEAMRHMVENALELIETRTTFGEIDLPLPPSRERRGAARRDRDVRDSDFSEVFGFRGVEFGNWNNQTERQELLNDAYDGLIDLSDVLGIPPRAISLGGELALAFGARGHGLSGARAHYEPTRPVINLTKENGAGSLAHEWMHALDHYLWRRGNPSIKWKTNEDGTRSLDLRGNDFEVNTMSGGTARDNVRPEVRELFQKLNQTMSRKAVEYVNDTAKVEAWVAKARDQVKSELDSLRGYLARPIDYAKRNNKPASADQLAAFDTLAEQILTGRDVTLRAESPPKARKGSYSTRWTNDALNGISAIMKAVRGTEGFAADGKGSLNRIGNFVRYYGQRLDEMAKANEGEAQVKAVPTDFRQAARELDQGRVGDYWSVPHEMLARAFQGYVEDKIAGRGGFSPFLNYGPEGAVIVSPWGFVAPFPRGGERKAINGVFDELFQTLQVSDEGDGKVGLFSLPDPEPQPVFYSAAARAIEEGKGAPKKGDAAAWKGWLDGAVRRGDMKQSERDWLDIDGWLGRQEGPITREALAEFVRANEVQVSEVVLGDSDLSPDDLDWSEVRELGDGFAYGEEADFTDKSGYRNKVGIFRAQDDDAGWWVYHDGQEIAEGVSEAEARRKAFDVVAANSDAREGGGRSKFSQYRTPGGENYRELLLTLPERATAAPEFVKDGDDWVVKQGGVEIARGDNLRALREDLALPQGSASRTTENYRSSHWDQPNVLAHIRMDERTDAEGRRVLFVQEIQSDWHQAGRKSGYRGTGTAKVEAVRDGSGWVAVDADNLVVTDEVYPTREQALAAADRTSAGVPNAPLKSTDEWAMLAFKRAARWAVDNGFDRIAWATGEQNADLFDLSKTLRRVEYTSDGYLLADDIRGRTAISERVPEDKLPDYIGKEAAEKLLAQTPRWHSGLSSATARSRVLEGQQLKVGGEGMRGFYDKILPTAVGKWAKKFGGKVGSAEFVGVEGPNDATRVHAIDITPAMVDAIATGQPLFSGIPGQPARAPGVAPSQLQAAIAGVIRGWNADTAPRVRVLADPEGLPARAKRDPRYRMAEGFYDQGNRTVYLIASNLPTERRALQVLAHESVGHYGMEAITGPELWAEIESAVARLETTATGKVGEALASARRRYAGADRATFTKEAIAVLAERGVQNSIVSRVVASVRRFLRSLGFDLRLSESDILAMLRDSARYLERGRQVAADQPVTGAAFARPDLDPKRRVPVIEAKANAYGPTGDAEQVRAARAAARADLNTQRKAGTKWTNAESGMRFRLSSDGIGELLSWTADPSKLDMLAALQQITEQGIVARVESSRVASRQAGQPAQAQTWATLYAPVKVGGKLKIARMVAKDAGGGAFVYDLQHSTVLDPTDAASDLPATESGSTGGPAGRAMTVSQLRAMVNADAREAWNWSMPADQLPGLTVPERTTAAGVLRTMAEQGGLFRYPPSRAGDLATVFEEVTEGTVSATYKGETLANFTEDLEDMAEVQKWELRTKDGRPMFVYVEVGGENRMYVDASPGRSGASMGSAVYAALFQYALNDGKVLIGDPNGLSPEALLRRTEHMLSAALKHGTTRMMAPHPRQVDPTQGQWDSGPQVWAHPLRWEPGNDDANLRALIETTHHNAAAFLRGTDGEGAVYSFPAKKFLTRDGRELTQADIARISKQAGKSWRAGLAEPLGNPNVSLIGPTTVARSIIAGTLLRAEDSQLAKPLLADMNRRAQAGAAAPAEGLFYSLREPEAMGANADPRGFLARLGALMKPENLTLREAIAAKLQDVTPAALGALTLRHIAELGKKYLPQLPSYIDNLNRMQTDRNILQEEGNELAEKWRGMQVKDRQSAEQMADLMHDATIEGVDPAEEYQPLTMVNLSRETVPITDAAVRDHIKRKRAQFRSRPGDDKRAEFEEIKVLRQKLAAEKRRRRTYPQLVARWNQLPAEWKELYREARDMYSKRSDQTLEALMARIGDLDMEDEQKRKTGAQIRLMFEQARLSGPYFPLQRFGSYWVAAKNPDTGKRDFFMFESAADQLAGQRDLQVQGYTDLASGKKLEQARDAFGAGEGFMTEVQRKLQKARVPPELQDEIWQLYLHTLPDLSQRKHMIHRKKVAGYNPDALRAFAANANHGAYQVARLRYGHKMQRLVMQAKTWADSSAKTDQGNQASIYYNELVKRHDWVMNPSDSALVNKISGLGFAWYLGVTPGAALVNLTQTAIVAGPVLASRFGAAKSMNALMKGMRDSIRTGGNIERTLRDEELRAYQAMRASGAIDKTQAHNLAGIAEVDSAQYSDSWHRVMKGISYLFHKAEVVNREATGMAAYRLGREQGMSFDAAVQYAEDIIWESHFDYCVDTETEALTLEGWKRYDQIRPGERVLGVDQDGRAVETSVEQVNVFPGPKRVLRFDSSRRFSMVLTPAHDVLVQRYDSKPKRWTPITKVPADQLKGHHQILRAPLAPIDGRQKHHVDDFAALLGWIAAEGQFAKFRGCDHRSDVRLAQSARHNPAYVEEIRGILERLGGECSEYSTRGGEIIVWTLKGELRRRVVEAMPEKLLHFGMLQRMTADQMVRVIDAFAKGDGHQRPGGGWTIVQKAGENAQNLEVLQAMATACGITATVSQKGQFRNLILCTGERKNTQRTIVKSLKVSPATVDTVWCPTTGTGNWIARRNGAVFVTGNSNANRARFMQSGAAKVLLMFRQYSLSMSYFLWRNFYQTFKGESPKIKQEARRKLLGVLGMTTVFSGALGLPAMSMVFGVANALADALGDDEDPPFNAEAEFRNFLTDFMGADVARLIARGPVNFVTGADIASRVTLDGLWLREPERELEGKALANYWLEQAAGPIGGIFVNAMQGLSLFQQGEAWRGVEAMTPKFVKDALRSIRYSTEGVNTLRGDALIPDLSPAQTVLQLAGLAPAQVNERYDANNAIKRYEESILRSRQRLLDGFALAVRLEDDRMRDSTLQRIRAFNAANPEIPIDAKTIRTSLQARARYTERSLGGVAVNSKIEARAREQGRFAEDQP